MPSLQGSGAISLNDVRNVFGGGNPVSISQFYKNGGRVPSVRTVNYTAQDGPVYSINNPVYYVRATGTDPNGNIGDFYWAGSFLGNGYASRYNAPYTYYRGAYRQFINDQYTAYRYYHEIYRQYPASYQVGINGNVPTGGQIALSNFYGAETA